MMESMIFPHMGDWIDEGKIVRWLKQEGDPVKQGDPLVEVETRKVNIELEAPCSGGVYEILVREGETVSVGIVLACIGEPDESFSAPILLSGCTLCQSSLHFCGGCGQGEDRK